MAFNEKPKVKDFAQVGIVTAKKYRCECGWVTRDEHKYREHRCERKDKGNSGT